MEFDHFQVFRLKSQTKILLSPVEQRGTIQVLSTRRFNYTYLIMTTFRPKTRKRFRGPTGFVLVVQARNQNYFKGGGMEEKHFEKKNVC